MSHRTMTVRLERIAACRLDLFENGIDISCQTAVELGAFVEQELEYFQLMLGDDSTPGQVLSLIRRDLAKVAVANRRAPGKGAWDSKSSRAMAGARPGTGRGSNGRDPERAGARRRVCLAH